MIIKSKSASNSGITRRLARVIFLQLLFISIITVLGVIVAAKVVEGVMMRTALEGEAQHFWSEYKNSATHPLPHTDNLRGYMSSNGSFTNVPQSLQSLEPGLGRAYINDREFLVLVDQREINEKKNILYLVFDEQSVAKLSFYFGVVPLSLVLIVIYLSAWFGFKQSRKALSPLVALASRLRHVDSEQSQEVNLDLDHLKTSSIDDEINILVDSLSNFTAEINQLIERERRFSRDASHELKTPLTIIQGSTEFLLSTDNLSQHQTKALERIKRTVHDMNQLVNALLILARGNRNMLELEQVSINQTILHQLEQLQITHNQNKQVSVTTDLRQKVEVSATPQFVDTVTGNLLRNAFNYTRKGEVHVVVDKDLFEVRNKGEGVLEPQESELFEPFVRGPSQSEATGHGVGLDIVNRLCELLQWKVESEFDPEHGMLFRIRF